MATTDDGAPEVLEDEPTDRETRAYKSAEFLAGQEAGFKEGVDAAVAALRGELIRARCTPEEIKHIIARVRAGSGRGDGG